MKITKIELRICKQVCYLILMILGFTACIQSIQENKERDTNTEPTQKVRRFGSVIKIKPDMIGRYKELHANPWPEVQKQITESNIRNYSIYLKDDYLFSYFEYVGDDFEADMKKMAEDSVTREWWKETDPCQIPMETRKEGEWWASMEEVFHQD